MRSTFSPHSSHRDAVKTFEMERRSKRRQPKTSRSWPSKNEMKNIHSYDIDPEEADVSSSTKGHMAGVRRITKAPRLQTSTYQMKSILSHDIDSKAPDIDFKAPDISSSSKGRIKRPRPASKAPQPQTPTPHQGDGPLSALGRTLETKAVRPEAEQRRARSASRAHRNQKKYAPSRSIWW